MSCPQCGYEYVCPCQACVASAPGKLPWLRSKEIKGTWNETCPKCGLTKDTHEWQDVFFEQYEKERLNEIQ